VLDRARTLVALSRAPAEHVARQRTRAHQQIRELRASSRRRLAEERELAARRLLVLDRKAQVVALEHGRAGAALRGQAIELSRAAAAALSRRARELERLELAIAAHDPERTLARGYALVEDPRGELVTTATAARTARDLSVRFRDGRVRAKVEEET
jgi:exodeoxyribonuclease VII large subunit